MSNNVENFILEEGKHLVFTSDLHFFHSKVDPIEIRNHMIKSISTVSLFLALHHSDISSIWEYLALGGNCTMFDIIAIFSC